MESVGDLSVDTEAQLVKKLEVKVPTRIGGKSSGDAGFMKRHVLRYDGVPLLFFWDVIKAGSQQGGSVLQEVKWHVPQ